MEEGNSTSLLRELGSILRDYLARIDRLDAETLRMRGESFGAWERKQRRIRAALELLERAAEVMAADPDADLSAIACEVRGAR